MKYNQLSVSKHATSKRLGRGISSGKGKTAGRGTKGQGSRAGSTKRLGFEGGQNRLMKALPKLPGFQSHHVKAVLIFTDQLEQLNDKVVDALSLSDRGIIANPYLSFKLLKRGEMSKPRIVKLPAASRAAIATIEEVGGSFEMVDRIARPKKADSKS